MQRLALRASRFWAPLVPWATTSSVDHQGAFLGVALAAAATAAAAAAAATAHGAAVAEEADRAVSSGDAHSVSACSIAQYPANDPIEDRIVVSLAKSKDQATVVGVLDGHAGWQVKGPRWDKKSNRAE